MDASDRRRRASEEAATWWVRLHSEELSRADREQFVDWLRESAVHVAEMLQVAKVHNALEEFTGWVNIADGPDDGDNSANGNHDNVVSLPTRARDEAFPNSSRRRLWIGAIAAGLAAAVVLGALLLPMLGGQTIQTEQGERREVALTDGSLVEVDPQTRLRVDFDDHVRRVTLERGRAFFRVAKNPARPFLVQSDGTTVRAVGTAFGVEQRNEGVIVTVAEGKVAVFVKGTSKPEPHILAAPDPEVFLTAGQQVRLSASGSGAPVRNVNSERELAWAKGQLVLDNESVADAVAQFNRYNRLQLHVTSGSLAERRVSGVFDASDPESFIGFLRTVMSVKVTRSDSEINMQ